MLNKITLVAGITLLSVSCSTTNVINNEKKDIAVDVKPIKIIKKTVKKTVKKPIVPVVKGDKRPPATAKVGECFVSAYVQPACQIENKKVLIRKAYNETKIVPAVTKEIVRTVLVSATKTIEEYVPALYETITKRILVSAAKTEWKRGNFSSVQKTIGGETFCLVNVPARYENKSEKILKFPASTKTRIVPAAYKSYLETVVDKPATTRIVKSNPAVYKTVKDCVDNKAGSYEWRSVLCEKNATKSTLTKFEKALSDRRYLNKDKVDGIIDNSTTAAIKKYQKSSGLKIDGLVNIEVVKSLGVKY